MKNVINEEFYDDNGLTTKSYIQTNINPRKDKWTNSAIYCFNRTCNCAGCFYKISLETKCVMYHTVNQLLDKIGTPPPEENLEPTKEQIEELYINKQLHLRDIYRILKIDKYDLKMYLERYNIPLRKSIRTDYSKNKKRRLGKIVIK